MSSGARPAQKKRLGAHGPGGSGGGRKPTNSSTDKATKTGGKQPTRSSTSSGIAGSSNRTPGQSSPLGITGRAALPIRDHATEPRPTTAFSSRPLSSLSSSSVAGSLSSAGRGNERPATTLGFYRAGDRRLSASVNGTDSGLPATPLNSSSEMTFAGTRSAEQLRTDTESGQTSTALTHRRGLSSSSGLPPRTQAETSSSRMSSHNGDSIMGESYQQRRIQELEKENAEVKEVSSQKSKVIVRLRDENNRLIRTQELATGLNGLQLGQQLAQNLGVSISPTATTDEVAKVLIAKVLHNRHESERSAEQVKELREKVQEMCSSLATEKTRTTTLAADLKQAKLSLSEKTKEAGEIQAKVTSTTEDTSRHESQLAAVREEVAALERRLHEAEDTKADSEALKTVAESKLSALTGTSSEMHKRLEEIEVERTEACQARDAWRKMHDTRIQKITRFLSLNDTATDEEILEKISEKVQSCQTLGDTNKTMETSVTNLEHQVRANQSTILRLAAEIEAQTAQLEARGRELEESEQEKTRALDQVQNLERQNRLRKAELDVNEGRLAGIRDEVANKDDQILMLESTISGLEGERHKQTIELSNMQRHVSEAASIGRGGSTSSRESSDASNGMSNVSELTELIKTLREQAHSEEQKNVSLSEEIAILHQQLEQEQLSTMAVQTQLEELRGQMEEREHLEETFETQLKVKDITFQNMETEHAQHSHFCKRLCDLLKIDQLTKDFGSGMQTEAIHGRIDQLLRQETSEIAEKSTSIYNLQRRLKTTKTNLESKELHIEMMGKKITTLEKRIVDLSQRLKDKHVVAEKIEKGQKANEKQAATIRQLKESINDLNLQLLDGTALQKTIEQKSATIQDLQAQLDKQHADTMRRTQLLSTEQKSLKASRAKVETEKHSVERECGVLREDLTTARKALDEVRAREKQLLELRASITMLLGLDISELSVPDYQVMARLEQLVKAHENHVSTARGVQSALQQLQSNFYSGCDEALQLVGSSGTRSARSNHMPSTRPAAAANDLRSTGRTNAHRNPSSSNTAITSQHDSSALHQSVPSSRSLGASPRRPPKVP
ncbi:coiled-coil domain-containing protein 170-like [Sycon ciliatum]|uniref:coiled-coil domain-containing protein 170-like n=1 Tax=Sycon ciliatum TaxID=27933 RepID=UPI0031F6B762